MSKILELLENVSQTDLDEIDKEIENLCVRAERLRKARVILAVSVKGNTEPFVTEVQKVDCMVPANGSTSPTRMKVLEYLGGLGKPLSGVKTMEALGLSSGSQGFLMGHPWFTRMKDGYILTKYGHEAYKKNFTSRA